MRKIGFLGPEGTFCEEASLQYTKKIKAIEKAKHIELIPFSSIHDLMLAVDKGEVDEGITPIENSVEGTVGFVQDILVKDVNLRIRGEIVLPIFHYLLARKGVNVKDITDIISHPQAIDQCKGWLRKNLPKAQIHLAYSTADAVKQVATSLGTAPIYRGGQRKRGPLYAAIGTLAAGKLYGLTVLTPEIQDYPDNLTRFVVLAKKDHVPTRDDKTSIVFSLIKDQPGGLYSILGEFAIRNINLTKIESRPSKRALGDYYFFADMQGHRKEKSVSDALAEIKRKVPFLKILGSYPRVQT